MPVCSDDTSNDNISKRRDLLRRYFEVQVLSVRSVSPARGTITIEAPAISGGTGFFEIPWTNEMFVWPFCPSTLLDSGEHRFPVPFPTSAAGGVVYLHETFLAMKGIRGGGTKWPIALFPDLPVPAALFTHTFPVKVHSLLLNATEQVDDEHEGQPKDLELMNRTLAPPQTLGIIDGPMEVKLTPEGCEHLGVKSSETRMVPVAVHSLVLSATEAVEDGEEGVPGEVNLMDRDLAPAPAALEVSGDSMNVTLSRDGCHKLGVEFPDLQHLRSALELLKRVATARAIVAACTEALEPARWEKVRPKWRSAIEIGEAKKLIEEADKLVAEIRTP